MTDLTRAIDAVLLAGHGQRHWLTHFSGSGQPGLDVSPVDALKFYGPGAPYDLWLMCRAVEQLRVAVAANEARAEKRRNWVRAKTI